MTDDEVTQRVIRVEQEAFIKLCIKRRLAWDLIGRPDTLLASEQIPCEGFDRLHLAAQRYQAAVNAIKRVAQQDTTLAKQEP